MLWFFQITSRRLFSSGVSYSDLDREPPLLLLVSEKPRERPLGDVGPGGGLFIFDLRREGQRYERECETCGARRR